MALLPSMFSYKLRLPFPHLVREVLYHLRLVPAHLHQNAWQILICCCILWQRALLKSNLEHANLNYHEFLLTYNIKWGGGDIYSFRGMHAPIALEPRYRKVPNRTSKFFFVYGHGWDFLVG